MISGIASLIRIAYESTLGTSVILSFEVANGGVDMPQQDLTTYMHRS